MYVVVVMKYIFADISFLSSPLILTHMKFIEITSMNNVSDAQTQEGLLWEHVRNARNLFLALMSLGISLCSKRVHLFE